MQVTFVLPGYSLSPSGGFKVIYEYASRLQKLGHNTSVIHPFSFEPQTSIFHIPGQNLWRISRSLTHNSRDFWVSLDPAVRVYFVRDLRPKFVRKGDIVVASAWETAEWVAQYPASKGRKYYLIHDYERYMVASPAIRKRMEQTYLAGMHNIVTSPAGKKMVERCGAKVNSYIPNGIDFDIYYVSIPIISKNRNGIGFPSRLETIKGTSDAIACLREVRKLNSTRNVFYWTFGSFKPPDLPAWIHFYHRPTDHELHKLYNRTRIFITPSHYEGWGLPGAEAMACGAALVSTDHGGVRAYAKDDYNAVLTAPQNVPELVIAVDSLWNDDVRRIRLAETGVQHIQQFTWENAIALFNDAITP